jgi:hypothetical protein
LIGGHTRLLEGLEADAGAKSARCGQWFLAYDLARENQLDLVGATDVEIPADDLLGETLPVTARSRICVSENSACRIYRS